MFLKYLIAGFGAGAVAAVFAVVIGVPPMAIALTFLLTSQLVFWVGMTLALLARPVMRRILGRLSDADYIKAPHRLDAGAMNQKPDLRCLLVDDDPVFLELMRTYLIELGYARITTCPSAAVAISTISEAATPFDCCFLDIEMPGMDGVELCGIIRQTPGYENTPLVMVTAMHGRAHVRSAFALGATDYITKPFELAELQSRISAIEIAAIKHGEIDLGPRMIPISALENYLLQLERGGLFSATVLTFKLNGHAESLSQASISDPKHLLREAAGCILEALSGEDALMSYAGGGVFAAVINKRRVEEAKIDQAIAVAEQAHPDITSARYRRAISVGSQMPMRWEKEDGESIFLLHYAIHATYEHEQVEVEVDVA